MVTEQRMTYSMNDSFAALRACAVKRTDLDSKKSHGTHVKPQPNKHSLLIAPFVVEVTDDNV